MTRRNGTQHLSIEQPDTDLAFDVDAFDTALYSQGVKVVHYKAMKCPVGMTDIGDNRRPHPDHSGCQNGFIYFKAGTVTIMFISNNKHKDMYDMGYVDGSVATVSIPRFYDDSDDRVIIAPFDRFFIDEPSILANSWQLFIHHETGLDRLKFPVEKIEYLMDANGVNYIPEQDFTVKDGGILWLGNNRPTPNLDLGPGYDLEGTSGNRGSVCSVRYYYRPYFYVSRMLHDLRIVQKQDELSGNRTVERMPQQAVIFREYIPINEEKDQSGVASSRIDSSDIRSILAPMNGGFGTK